MVLLFVALLAPAARLSAQTIAATTNDVTMLRQMLATVAAWDARGKKAFDAPLLAELDALWRKGYDPLLRIRTQLALVDRTAEVDPRVGERSAKMFAQRAIAREQQIGVAPCPADVRECPQQSRLILDRMTTSDVYEIAPLRR